MPDRGTLYGLISESRSLRRRRRPALKPEVGMPYVFIPYVCEGQEYLRFAGRLYPTKIEGVIIAVNQAHRHFTVRGKHPQTGAIFTETFKF